MGGERSRSPKHRDSRRHHKRYYDEDDYKKKSKDKVNFNNFFEDKIKIF